VNNDTKKMNKEKLWPLLSHYSGSCLETVRKYTKNLRIVDVLAGI
jgi:hypothetical protein